MLEPVRRLFNAMGVDVVRYDPSRRPPRKNGPKPSLPKRLVIGGGDHDYGPEWHNVEYVTEGYADKYKTLSQNIDIPHDLTSGKPLPVRDNTILAAYCSHVFEHLKDEHVQFTLRDTCRALQPGGYFRVSCPNVDLYMRAFLEKDFAFFHYRDHPHYARLGIKDSLVGMFLDVFATKLGERATPFTEDEVRSTIERLGPEQAAEFYSAQVDYDYQKSHYHVNWFNPAKIMRMAQQAGFRTAYVSALGQSFCPEMRDLTTFDLGDPKISLFVECVK